MKKRICSILLAFLLLSQLPGCGAETDSPQNGSEPGISEASSSEETGEFENVSEILDAMAIQSLAGKDNSLDAYSLTVNLPLRVERPEGAIAGGGSEIFLGDTRAYYFQKHLFENVEECWDELAYVTVQRESGQKVFERKNQVWNVGAVFGTDHWLRLEYEKREEDSYDFFLSELDEEDQALRRIPLTCLDGSGFAEVITSLSGFMMDGSGRIHLKRLTQEGWRYEILSPEGEVLADYRPLGSSLGRFVPLYDGRVAVQVKDTNQGFDSGTLQYLDPETGKTVTLATLAAGVYYCTLLEENTLLYADQKGVYRSGLSGENPELLYQWSNHGIIAADVKAMQASDERIALIYESGEEMNYLCLEPTTEEVEVRKITLAVPSYMDSFYRTVATQFNRRYPSCRVEIKSTYDETALLTELIAGKGPVLIDTILIGFEEQKKLWQPLDEIFEQLGIAQELEPSALELGKIDGTLYAAPSDFTLSTLLTGETELQDWDYDTFLQCVKERPELEAIFDCDEAGDYGTYFIMSFLNQGLEDSYLLDAESGTTYFDSDRFRDVLEMAKKYCVRKEAVPAGDSLTEGKVLCNRLTVQKPEDIALIRICGGEDINYIGYPTKDGAEHFLEAGNMLAIRKTATKEEKEIACAFLEMFLSYEGQYEASKDINFGLSVRRDILEEQIARMDEHSMPFLSNWGQITLGDRVDREKDRETLLRLIGEAKPKKYFPKELSAILLEELRQYFADGITQDMVIDHLKNRVELYLNEHR